MARCADVTLDGNYKDMGQMMSKLIEVIGLNNDCALRHDALVEYETKKVK